MKRAYEQKASELHPDRVRDPTKKEKATETLQELATRRDFLNTLEGRKEVIAAIIGNRHRLRVSQERKRRNAQSARNMQNASDLPLEQERLDLRRERSALQRKESKLRRREMEVAMRERCVASLIVRNARKRHDNQVLEQELERKEQDITRAQANLQRQEEALRTEKAALRAESIRREQETLAREKQESTKPEGAIAKPTHTTKAGPMYCQPAPKVVFCLKKDGTPCRQGMTQKKYCHMHSSQDPARFDVSE